MILTKTALTDETSEDPGLLPSFTADFQYSKSEQRSEARKNCLYNLECKVYHLEKDFFETTPAVALNYSKSGLYFKTNHLFESGSPVYILLKVPEMDPFDGEFAKGVHAQVVWCKMIDNGSKPSYGVGLRFFERFRTQKKDFSIGTRNRLNSGNGAA
jgi:Tfp pilus assembly protein PilZ